MLEPYLMGISQINMGDIYLSLPFWAAGGGFQFGVKGGSMGAFFIDVNFLYTFGEVKTINASKTHPKPEVIEWNRFALGIGLGYKIGFIDRPKRERSSSE